MLNPYEKYRKYSVKFACEYNWNYDCYNSPYRKKHDEIQKPNLVL